MQFSELIHLANKDSDHSLIPKHVVEEALLIRLVEQKFLDLFSKGRVNGTVHTCVGQEFSAVAVAGQLTEDDWVTSNHRCHGHFISKTKNWQGLVDELMGLESGVCKGIGSSQHLYAQGFMSNGPQAALVPVATGIALHKKLNKLPGIAVSFIGEGTLGEGVLYESFNLASLYKVPHLIVCENNFYSQSTSQADGVAGNIKERPEAFGIRTFEADTWDVTKLFRVAKDAIQFVREGNPAFLIIRTYRLNPHSKGDDNRDADELNFFNSKDLLNVFLEDEEWRNVSNGISIKIENHINSSPRKTLHYSDYAKDQLPRDTTAKLGQVLNPKIRMVQALNEAYRQTLLDGSFHIGEDIADPYGGAFKVTKGLSTEFPDYVRNSSISEAGLIGVATGMALMGTKSFAEIMFGDFMTHAFDQLISNASKMHHMYAFQTSVPLRIRTPMGGKRGYGPTHSQSLEKHLLGIDNVGVIALSSLLNPALVIEETKYIDCPLVILESKSDYGKFLWTDTTTHSVFREQKAFGALKLSPTGATPTITIVSYGESARHIADNLELFFYETDYIPELICVTQLHPLDISLIEKSVNRTGNVLIVEDGSISFGFVGEYVSGK
ncbi:thiamine pyrophosphate-dependent enzyme [Pseudomonas sp. CCI4.2]|uniref:alpha-ketoacid dehydrogenase subunit alpha/beta n=1 Tax=Pseudomonas sp. CCI4.2 TaxID=3048620 RepID=UPI002AC91A7C|nr:thiamine pyrophosphate-dependent enzyme [Pseudomonas sp. CCI4.2]WPX54015.1 thiamine pyrophosphate-dependent enzyme [Pseudomonas sp. CCI4.2]